MLEKKSRLLRKDEPIVFDKMLWYRVDLDKVNEIFTVGRRGNE